MSAVVSPASSIAARQPSSVSSNGSRNSRRPISDCPTPVMHAAPFDDLVATSIAAPPRRVRTSGRYTSPSGSGWCSNVTRTGMPISISSSGQFTRLVVSRTDGCSTISTIATTYGSSGPGIQFWWLIEYVASVARPDTASTARFFEWSIGQIGCGGWM